MKLSTSRTSAGCSGAHLCARLRNIRTIRQADRRRVMSSPAYDDAADQSISASPPPLLDHESEEVRRLHDQVAEAAEVLIGDARKPADQDAEPYVGNDSFDLVLATRRMIESEASRSGLW